MASAHNSKKRMMKATTDPASKLIPKALENEFDVALSSDIKGILAALHQVREKAQKDGRKKNEELVSRWIPKCAVKFSDFHDFDDPLHRVPSKLHNKIATKALSSLVFDSLASEIKTMVDEIRSRSEKERQNLIKVFTKLCKDYEASLKSEYSKYQSSYERYSKERHSHTQTSEELFLKFEEERDKLLVQYDQHRKKEKAALLDLQKACGQKLAAAEESLKKKNQEDRSLDILRKSLGSFLESNSDDYLDE